MKTNHITKLIKSDPNMTLRMYYCVDAHFEDGGGWFAWICVSEELREVYKDMCYGSQTSIKKAIAGLNTLCRTLPDAN